MHVVPIILRPKILSVKNRWKNSNRQATQYTRDVVIALFTIAVMYGMYRGTFETVTKIQANATLAQMEPSLPLGLVLLMLLTMLLFSNSVTALGALFLSHDLDLILASPVSNYTLFRAKVIEVLTSSSWMAIVFGAPVIVGFGVGYHADWLFYPYATLVLIPYFLMSSALAIFGVTIFARIIPANRTREILLVVCALALLGIYLVVKILIQTGATSESSADLLKIVQILSVPSRTWLPSYWSSICLGEYLHPKGVNTVAPLGMLYGVASFFLSLAFLSMSYFHYSAYSKARSNKHGIRIHSRTAQRRISRVYWFVQQPYRAIIAKEYKVFARDMSQAIQLMLLLGLCMIYLYNFRILSAVEGFPEATQMWWSGFLIISNLSMGAFVVTAVGTRFVFPSMSLEGQAYWLLQSSPLSMLEIIRAKFWAWFVPVSLIASVIFASGALAINAEPHIVVLSTLTSFLISYGIVGMAVGLGAFFANFNWEHSSQLAASFGSLVYMLTSTALIGLNMLPTSMMIFLRTLKNFHYKFTTFEWYTAIGGCTLILIYLNYAATKWAIKMGAQALEDRRK